MQIRKRFSSNGRSSVITGFLLLLIALAANAVIIRRQLGVQVGDQVWVAHTRQVLFELAEIESILKDAETGQRGFLDTGNQKYLSTYNLAISQVESHVETLAKLTVDNPRQMARVSELRNLAEVKVSELGRTISLHQAGKSGDAKTLILTGAGLTTTDDIRKLVEDMGREESALDTDRSAAYQESIRTTIAAIYGANFIAALGLVILAYYILRQMEARDRDARQMREHEALLRTVTEQARVGLTLLSSDGRYIYANAAYTEALRLRATDSIVGKRVSDVLLRLYDQVGPRLDRAFAGERVKYELAVPVRPGARDGGQDRSYEVTYEPLQRPGDGTNVIAVVVDITERKLAEESLRVNEERLRLAQQAAGMGTFDFEFPSGKRTWSPEMRELYGLAPDGPQPTNEDVRGLIHPEDRSLAAEQSARLAAGKNIKFDYRIIRPDGRLCWIETSGHAILGTDGEIRRYLGISSDITKRKATEELVRVNEERLRLARDVAGMATFDVELPSGKRKWSSRAFEIFGLDPDGPQPGPEELVRMSHPDDRSMVAEQMALIPSGKRLHFEYRIIRPDGEVRWLESIGQAIFGDGGKPIRYLGVGFDITARKVSEELVRVSKDQLRALAARLQTAIERERLQISRELHDQLGQALTGIKMDLEWIVRKHGAGESVWVPLVHDSMNVVDSTITLVRKLSTDLRPELLDALGLPAAIEWHADQFQRRTGVPCLVSVPEHSLEISGDIKIAAFRIFQEALTNIARHAHAKNVLINLERQGEELILAITDDGVGFSLDILDHAQSLGVLGMRERAILLGAEFHLASVAGDGTTVTLRIPLDQSAKTGLEAHEHIDS